MKNLILTAAAHYDTVKTTQLTDTIWPTMKSVKQVGNVFDKWNRHRLAALGIYEFDTVFWQWLVVGFLTFAPIVWFITLQI